QAEVLGPDRALVGRGQEIDQGVAEAQVHQRDPLVVLGERAAEDVLVEPARARLIRDSQDDVIEAERLVHRATSVRPKTTIICSRTSAGGLFVLLASSLGAPAPGRPCGSPSGPRRLRRALFGAAPRPAGPQPRDGLRRALRGAAPRGPSPATACGAHYAWLTPGGAPKGARGRSAGRSPGDRSRGSPPLSARRPARASRARASRASRGRSAGRSRPAA